MNRRRLLQGAAGLAALLPVSGLMRRANADLPALLHPMLVHTMMLGGPDFRHMFPPAFDSPINSYGYRFYEGRARALGIAANASAFADKWQNGYAHFSAGQTEFGMLAGCDWLGDMWRAGHVAIIANVVGAESRDHEHAQRVWESADRTLSQVSAPPTGWGGRPRWSPMPSGSLEFARYSGPSQPKEGARKRRGDRAFVMAVNSRSGRRRSGIPSPGFRRSSFPSSGP